MNTNRFHLHRQFQKPFAGEWSLVFRMGTPDGTPGADDGATPPAGGTTKITPVPEDKITYDNPEAFSRVPEGIRGNELAVVTMMEKFQTGINRSLEGTKDVVDDHIETLTKNYNAQISTLDALDRAEKKLNAGDMTALEFIGWANKVYASYKKFEAYWNRGLYGEGVARKNHTGANITNEKAYNDAATPTLKDSLVASMEQELRNILRETREDVEREKREAEKVLQLFILQQIEAKVSEELDTWENNQNLRQTVTAESLEATLTVLRRWPDTINALRSEINNNVQVDTTKILEMEDNLYDMYTSRREEIQKVDKNITLESVIEKSNKLKAESSNPKAQALLKQIEDQAKQVMKKLNDAEAKLKQYRAEKRLYPGDEHENEEVYKKQMEEVQNAREGIAKYIDKEITIEALNKQKAELVEHLEKEEAALIKDHDTHHIDDETFTHRMDELHKSHTASMLKKDDAIDRAEKYIPARESVKMIWEDTGTFPPTNDGRKFPRGIDHQIEFASNLPPFQRQKYLEYLNYTLDEYQKHLGVKGLKTEVSDELNRYEKKIDDYLHEFETKAGTKPAFKLDWVSFHTGQKFVEKIKEWAVRRYDRQNDRKVGEIGERITKNLVIPYTRTLPSEFNSLIHHAEGEEVHKYEGILEHLQDPQAVRKVLVTTVNQDEFRAAIQVLVKSGDMRWDDDRFLKKLNYFQHAVHFYKSIFETRKTGEFNKKLQLAFTAMFHSPQIFVEWKKSNASSYDSSKSQFTAEFNEMAENNEGGLKGLLKELLMDHVRQMNHSGDSNVDQHKYEGAIEYCAKQGKMSPQDRIYYLIQGMATGLLSSDRGKVLDATLLNDMPALEMFNKASKLTMVEVKMIAQLDKDKYEPGTRFNTFFTYDTLHNQSVYERVQKALTGKSGGMDHDDFASYSGVLQPKVMQQLMEKNAAGFTLPKTAMPNATVGFLDYIDIMAHSYDKIPNKKMQLARYVNTVLLFNNISNGNMYKKDGERYFRWGANEDKEVPRAAGSVMRGKECSNWNARQFLDESLRMIKPLLDEDGLYTFINNPGGQSPDKVIEKVRKINDRYGEKMFGQPDPADYDALINTVGIYVGKLIDKNQGLVHRMFENIKQAQLNTGKEEAKKAADEMQSIDSVMSAHGPKARHEEGLPANPGEEAQWKEWDEEREEYEKQVEEGHIHHHGHGHDDHGGHGGHGGHGDDHGHGGGHHGGEHANNQDHFEDDAHGNAHAA